MADQQNKNKFTKTPLPKQILQVLIFIYIFSVTFQKLIINDFNVGQYLKPIASIPFLLVFAVDLAAIILIEKISMRKIISHIGQTAENIANQKISTIIFNYIWNGLKQIFKQVIYSMLIILPVMLIFAVIQGILTGNFNTKSTFQIDIIKTNQ